MGKNKIKLNLLQKDFRKINLKIFFRNQSGRLCQRIKIINRKTSTLGKRIKGISKKQKIIKALLSKGYEYDLILGEFE
jgi:SOS response regulatory protein OraA/RecX